MNTSPTISSEIFEILSFLLEGRSIKLPGSMLLLLLGPFLDLSGNGTRINQRIVGNYIEYDQIYRHLLLWITQVL